VFFHEASIIIELEYWHFRDQTMKSQTNGSKLFGLLKNDSQETLGMEDIFFQNIVTSAGCVKCQINNMYWIYLFR
jgi:hypothetical protein